ncbi:MAG: hypothetical protein LBU92_01555 [Prevotellaceae bacterium]|jgi:hypothetical protein|nr:hypothetical protein [Prevotellaceae bacterium]
MKKLFLLITLTAMLLNAQAASKPQRLMRITDHISMGSSEKGVLALLSGTLNMAEKNEVNVTTLARYKYNRDMMGSAVRYDAAKQQYFAHSAVTKMYVVENPSPLWPSCQRLEFFFYKEYGSTKPFTLFAIYALHKVEVGNMNAIFEKRVQESTANRNGEAPLILNTTYDLQNGKPVPAKLATWKMDTNREVLFVPDNGTLIFAEYTYVDEQEYKAWQLATEAYKKAMNIK